MKNIKIKLDYSEVEISKLALGKYSELLKAIKRLPKSVMSLNGKTNDEIFDLIPSLIGESLPDVIDLLTIATPLSKEEIENLGLDEVVRIVIAVIEVNNYQDVFNSLKKVIARPAQVEK